MSVRPGVFRTVTAAFAVQTMAKVSVVMSVYNGAAFLREAVASVFAQTFSDFEFIIINDGSTDASAQMLAEFTDPRIRVVHQENRGLVASLNRGIELATGDYIARMDADDRCMPHRLAVQTAYLDSHPEIALLGGSICTMDQDGNPLAPRVGFPRTHEEIWSAIGRRPWVFCHPAVMYRRAAALEAGLYHPDFAHAEDTEFFARFMSRFRAANLNDVLLCYRLTRGAISFSKREHGQINAQLVAAIIDRHRPGEPFTATAQERRDADERIARATAQQRTAPPSVAEAFYQLRLGRELLRGRQWQRARRHYHLAIQAQPVNRTAWMGWTCSLLHLGAEPELGDQPAGTAVV